jgi:hypothetical protein
MKNGLLKIDMDKTMIEAPNSAFEGKRIQPRALQRGR